MDEIETGFTLFVMRMNLWVGLPEDEMYQHCGATVGRALSYLALDLEAQAYRLHEKRSDPSAENQINQSDVQPQFLDEVHRSCVRLLDLELNHELIAKWDVWLLQNPTIKRSTIMDYKAGRIAGKVSKEKRLEIEAAIFACAKKLGIPISD